jgi:hypothetical protein
MDIKWIIGGAGALALLALSRGGGSSSAYTYSDWESGNEGGSSSSSSSSGGDRRVSRRVAFIQTACNLIRGEYDHGLFEPLEVDGLYGPLTQHAVQVIFDLDWSFGSGIQKGAVTQANTRENFTEQMILIASICVGLGLHEWVQEEWSAFGSQYGAVPVVRWTHALHARYEDHFEGA